MRTKIIAGNLAVVLLVGLVSYAMVRSSLTAALLDEVDSRIVQDFRLLERSFRLSARELAEMAHEQAAQRGLIDTFVTALDETGRRTRAYEAAERVASWLADPARRGATPDLVVVIDDHGQVVARNADRNRMYRQDLARELPEVRAALAGETASGIWIKEDEHGKILQIATSPIVSEGRTYGVLLVGYDLSNGLAESEGTLLGRDVAFVAADRVYSSSLSEGAESEALRAYLTGEGQAAAQAALAQRITSPGFRVTLAGAEYVAVIGAVPGAAQAPLAMVVLANRSAQMAKASPINIIVLMTVLGSLIVIAYGFLIATTFLTPIEEMEETVLQVINGRTDLRIDIESSELGGLAYRVNQLLNVFTGTEESDEEGRVSTPPNQQRWQDDAGGEAAPATAPAGTEEEADPALAAQLAAEPEGQYYARVYKEYIAAKQAAGEDVSNIAEDKFTQRLRANEQKLVAKHNCRMVRFQVETRGTQVNLKPVVIR